MYLYFINKLFIININLDLLIFFSIFELITNIGEKLN